MIEPLKLDYTTKNSASLVQLEESSWYSFNQYGSDRFKRSDPIVNMLQTAFSVASPMHQSRNCCSPCRFLSSRRYWIFSV